MINYRRKYVSDLNSDHKEHIRTLNITIDKNKKTHTVNIQGTDIENV